MGEDKKRIKAQYVFDSEAQNEIETIVKLTHSTSKAQAVRKAIHIANVLLARVKEGERIVLIAKDNMQSEILI